MQGGSHMAIGVERQRDRAVAEEFLYDFGMDTPAEQMRGRRMPEIVDSDPRKRSLI